VAASVEFPHFEGDFTAFGVAPDPEPEFVEFPGIEELYERFWDEIPKPRFGPSDDNGDTND